MEQGLKKDLKEILKKKLADNNLGYAEIPTEKEMIKIYNLWMDDIFEEPETSVELFYFGSFYENVTKNYDEMKKYFLMAIEFKNPNAIFNLGYYYHFIEKDYNMMKKYYLMGIELNKDVSSMFNLGNYYRNVEKNYDEMKKYFLMAIELRYSNAMNNLGHYYENKNKMTKALYYYSMANNSKVKDILFKIIALDDYFFKSLPHLKKMENLPIFVSMFIKLYTKEVDVLEAAFNYAPGQPGFEAALQDFQHRLSTT